jgi:hypothetical protein
VRWRYNISHFIGLILRDARKSGLLRMRSLMVRSASSRVSNHEATEEAAMIRANRKYSTACGR